MVSDETTAFTFGSPAAAVVFKVKSITSLKTLATISSLGKLVFQPGILSVKLSWAWLLKKENTVNRVTERHRNAYLLCILSGSLYVQII